MASFERLGVGMARSKFVSAKRLSPLHSLERRADCHIHHTIASFLDEDGRLMVNQVAVANCATAVRSSADVTVAPREAGHVPRAWVGLETTIAHLA